MADSAAPAEDSAELVALTAAISPVECTPVTLQVCGRQEFLAESILQPSTAGATDLIDSAISSAIVSVHSAGILGLEISSVTRSATASERCAVIASALHGGVPIGAGVGVGDPATTIRGSGVPGTTMITDLIATTIANVPWPSSGTNKTWQNLACARKKPKPIAMSIPTRPVPIPRRPTSKTRSNNPPRPLRRPC